MAVLDAIHVDLVVLVDYVVLIDHNTNVAYFCDKPTEIKL